MFHLLDEILLLDHGYVALAEIREKVSAQRATDEKVAAFTAAPLVHPCLGSLDELSGNGLECGRAEGLVGNDPMLNLAKKLDRYNRCPVEIFFGSGSFYIPTDALDGDAAVPDGILYIVTLIERDAAVGDGLFVVSVGHAGRM